MSIQKRKKLVYLVLGGTLLLSMLACRIEAPRIVMDETPTPVPTMIITQVVTEIVVVPSTPVPPPTQLPEPTPTATWSILDAPIYYPLENCVASRLRVGDQAMVSLVGGGNAIRTDVDLQDDGNIIHYADPGEYVNILNGPWCSYGYIMWFVSTVDGVRGFTPEGDGNEYWLWPVQP